MRVGARRHRGMAGGAGHPERDGAGSGGSQSSGLAHAFAVAPKSARLLRTLPPAQRGVYLKLSETGSKRPRSTVLLPGSAIKWVYSLIDYYIRECAAG
jgi:hypothetical protein